jgi:hypothetical protein
MMRREMASSVWEERCGGHGKDIEGPHRLQLPDRVRECREHAPRHRDRQDSHGQRSQPSLTTQPIAAGQAPVVELAPGIAGTALQGHTLSAPATGKSGSASRPRVPRAASPR